MISFPNAKINLGLNIVSKREDGYHNLETIFYPLMIKDALEIIERDGDEDIFIESGLQTVASPESNLVMKALMLMRGYYDIPFLEIQLLKKIPFGAGIGGGSADAAFMLRLLNAKFDLNIPENKLAELARQLGADCPFFIYNRPLFASGIGEVFEEVNVSLENFHLALVKPGVHVSTKDAFALIVPEKPKLPLKEIVKLPVAEWKEAMVNDFEKSIFPKYPEIMRIKEKLYDLGAVYTSMSGSGSSVYAVFEEKQSLNEHFAGCYLWQQDN